MSDCPDCGKPMKAGGVALACGPRGQSATIRLPDYCNDQQCKRDREEAVIQRAIERGVIDP